MLSLADKLLEGSCDHFQRQGLLPARESTSSKKMMEGAAWRAILKVPLRSASPSPTYMLYSCAPERGNIEALLAVAAALASVVLLQPAYQQALRL